MERWLFWSRTPTVVEILDGSSLHSPSKAFSTSCWICEILYTHVHDSHDITTHMVVVYVEIEDHSVAYFNHIDHIAAFKALYYPDSVMGGVHMHSVDILDIQQSVCESCP